jgi:hypothetical protein
VLDETVLHLVCGDILIATIYFPTNRPDGGDSEVVYKI